MLKIIVDLKDVIYAAVLVSVFVFFAFLYGFSKLIDLLDKRKKRKDGDACDTCDKHP